MQSGMPPIRLFSIEETSGWEYEKFKRSSWGRLHEVLPWDELVDLLPIRTTIHGPDPYFDAQGMLALMFLKHHTGLSDEKLIESINHNVSQQLFCGMRLGPLELIRDTGIASRVRGYLSQHLDLDEFQNLLVKHWKGDLSHQRFLKMDATCVESYIRYPTDVKLLWECSQWIYGQLFALRKLAQQPLGKAKERFDQQYKKQSAYLKFQRPGHKRTRRRLKSLLNLLYKGCWQVLDVLKKAGIKDGLGNDFHQRFQTIFQIYDQQQFLYDHPGEKVADRIVSLAKPYLRPIKRGKEKKPTEFGAKVHMLQVDGICVIEHFSWDAFYEGHRLKPSVELHRDLFGPCHQLSADRGYTSNANRRYCATEGIQTNFVGKGPKPKKEIQLLRSQLNKERATKLEGAFGNQKNNYLLAKVKARNEHTERVWIYFGVMTANANWTANKRLAKQKAPPRQAAIAA